MTVLACRARGKESRATTSRGSLAVRRNTGGGSYSRRRKGSDWEGASRPVPEAEPASRSRIGAARPTAEPAKKSSPPADPRAGQRKSTDFASPADPDPWSESKVSEAVGNRDLENLDRHLQSGLTEPNLRDLHGSDGALARLAVLSARRRGPESMLDAVRDRILELAGYGELRDGRYLFQLMDLTRTRLPKTAARAGIPPSSGVVSITDYKRLRVTDGTYLSTPIRVDDLGRFATRLSARGAPTETVSRTLPADWGGTRQGLDLQLTEHGLRAGGKPVAADMVLDLPGSGLAPAEDPILTVRWGPGSLYGDLVAVIDRLLAAELADRFRLALVALEDVEPTAPQALVLSFGSEGLVSPALAVKSDVKVPVAFVSGVLREVGLAGCRSLVFVTELEMPQNGEVAPGTFPGGMPGGISAELLAIVDR